MSSNDTLPMRVTDLEVALVETGEPILKGVSFDLHPGKIFALVGESGSGKSVTSLAAMRLLPEALGITGGVLLGLGLKRQPLERTPSSPTASPPRLRIRPLVGPQQVGFSAVMRF